MGETVIDRILKENISIGHNTIYKSLLNVRKNNYLYIKITNHILKSNNFKLIEKSMKISKHLIEPIYKIYQIIDIDNYLYPRILQILNKENDIIKSLFLIKINVEIIDIFLSDYFFNNLEKEIDYFLEILDNNYNNLYNLGEFSNISYKCNDIHNNKIFNHLKKCVFEFLE